MIDFHCFFQATLSHISPSIRQKVKVNAVFVKNMIYTDIEQNWSEAKLLSVLLLGATPFDNLSPRDYRS